MNKSTKTEKTEAGTPPPAPQTRRYDEAFKQQAVENWIKTGQPGTQIAEELGVSYPSSPEQPFLSLFRCNSITYRASMCPIVLQTLLCRAVIVSR